MKKEKKKREFSKILVAQESVLIWITTIALLVLAFICLDRQYFGEFPWITAMVGFPWTAYGVSQAFYYNKAKRENELKIKKEAKKEGIELSDNLFDDLAANLEPGYGESYEDM